MDTPRGLNPLLFRYVSHITLRRESSSIRNGAKEASASSARRGGGGRAYDLLHDLYLFPGLILALEAPSNASSDLGCSTMIGGDAISVPMPEKCCWTGPMSPRREREGEREL